MAGSNWAGIGLGFYIQVGLLHALFKGQITILVYLVVQLYQQCIFSGNGVQGIFSDPRFAIKVIPIVGDQLRAAKHSRDGT